jgi:hypothetical protein
MLRDACACVGGWCCAYMWMSPVSSFPWFHAVQGSKDREPRGPGWSFNRLGDYDVATFRPISPG